MGIYLSLGAAVALALALFLYSPAMCTPHDRGTRLYFYTEG
jgi:hypothetical protein